VTTLSAFQKSENLPTAYFYHVFMRETKKNLNLKKAVEVVKRNQKRHFFEKAQHQKRNLKRFSRRREGAGHLV
jgi:hypothetical protein